MIADYGIILEIVGFVALLLQKNNLIDVIKKKTETRKKEGDVMAYEDGNIMAYEDGNIMAYEDGTPMKYEDEIITTKIKLTKGLIFSILLVVFGLVLQHSWFFNTFPKI